MKIFAAVVALLIGSPAFADYITQGPTDSNATGLQNATPNPGVDCPAGTRFCVWAPVSGDTTLSRYSIDSGNNQVYTPYSPPSYPAPADPISFQTAVINDIAAGTLSPNWANYLPLVANAYARNPVKCKQVWTKVTTSPPAWMLTPSGQINLVKSEAVSANMPLE